jgi:hypothetical protein
MSDKKWGVGENFSYMGKVKVGKKEYPLVYGEHPHSTSDNNFYVEILKSEDENEYVGFNGHRNLIDIVINSKNYMKESFYSGNEVRKSVVVEIFSDKVKVYEIFGREVEYCLLKSWSVLQELRDNTSGWLIQEYREKLVGRKIFYREKPAIVESLIVDQGCIVVKADGCTFPKPIYKEEDDTYEENEYVKVEVLDSNIWWFRK